MTEGRFELLPGCAFAGLRARTWEEVLGTMCERVVERGHARATFPAAVLAREARFPTGLPTAVPAAIPHTDPEHVLTAGFAVATLAEPVSFREMGRSSAEVAVRLVVMLCLTDAAAQVATLQFLLARLGDADATRRLVEEATPENCEAMVAAWLGVDENA